MKHRLITLAALLALVTSGLICARMAESAAGVRAEPTPPPQRRPTTRRRRRAPAPPAQRAARVDYSKFSHATPKHREKSCDSCHTIPTPNWSSVREGDAAFPDVTDYPGHSSCLDCHKRQFFVGARPVICSICHTVVSPRGEARHPFQNPGELFVKSQRKAKADSDFVINFPHDRHQDVMAFARPTRDAAGGFAFVRAAFRRQAAPKEVDSCTLCHKTYQPQGDSPDEYAAPAPKDLAKNDLSIEAFWLKKGTMKTTPSSHASCFNCHWQEGGEKPLSNDCAGCHKPRPAATPFAKPTAADADPSHPSAKAITDAEVLADWSRRRVARFKHEVSNHQSVGCTACHVTITAVNRLDADTLYVPIQTCSVGSCHGSTRPPKNVIFREVEQRKKPDGAGYQCAKCHVNLGKAPTPKSHADLFPAK